MKILYATTCRQKDAPAVVADKAKLLKRGFTIVEDPLQIENDIDALVFRTWPGGYIPHGMGELIKIFQEMGKPILEIPSSLNQRVLSEEETAEVFYDLGES